MNDSSHQNFTTVLYCSNYAILMGKCCYHSNWHNWQLPTQTAVRASDARSPRAQCTYVVYVGSRSVCFEPAVVCYLQGDVNGRIPAFPSSMRWSRAVTGRPVSAVPALSRSHPEPVLLSRAPPAPIVPAVLRHEPAVKRATFTGQELRNQRSRNQTGLLFFYIEHSRVMWSARGNVTPPAGLEEGTAHTSNGNQP